MNCNAQRHLRDRELHGKHLRTPAIPPAVCEWFDPIVGRWRPVCVECLDIIQRNYAIERARFTTDPIGLAGFDAMVRFRNLVTHA